MKEVALGIGLAAILLVFFGAGNSLTDGSRLSIFPSAISLLTIPAFVYAAQRMQHRNGTLHTAATLKRYGWNIVKWAATLFALFVAAVAAVSLTPSAAFVVLVCGFAWFLTAAVGYMAADACSRIVAKRRPG